VHWGIRSRCFTCDTRSVIQSNGQNVINFVDEENGGRGCLMSNDTFDNISVISWSVLSMEETGENHRRICRKSLIKFIT
jgi:hypothetical protein